MKYDAQPFELIKNQQIAEGIFESFARSLRVAVALDENFKDQLPSTKGVL